MKYFVSRTLIFISLWAAFLYQIKPFPSLAMMLFICALSISGYFFLAIIQKSLPLFIAISITIFFAYLISFQWNNIYAALLLFFLYVESVFRLSMRHFRIFTLFHLLFVGCIVFLQEGDRLELAIFSFLLYFTSWVLNEQVINIKEQKDIHEHLLEEFRKLKRLSFEAERTARLEERTKIARDMHDSVGHKLTALLMQIEIISMNRNDDALSTIKKLAQQSLDETRQAVSALTIEKHEGITAVLHLIRKLESESHLQINFSTRQGILSAKISNNQSVVLYRVIQEALTNVMRHAHSRHVDITLEKSAIGDLQFTVINSMMEEKPFQPGFGLNNMKQRVLEVGGKLQVYQTSKNFVVSGTIPIGSHT